MKKILTITLLFSLLFISCSSDDDSDTIVPTVAATMTPPNWTHGTWNITVPSSIKGFTFSSFNLCQILKDDTSSCYQEKIINHNFAHLTNIVEESKSAETYNVTIKLHKTVVTYKFRKGEEDLNGNYLMYWIIPNANPELLETEIPMENTKPKLPPVIPPVTPPTGPVPGPPVT